MFINTRLTVISRNFGMTSATEAPAIVVQDAFNTGGAQQSGRVRNKNLTFASDLDYIRGISSWRAGVQIYGSSCDALKKGTAQTAGIFYGCPF